MNKVEDPVPTAPKTVRKRVIWLASAIVGVLALTVAGIAVVPKLIHAQQLTDYRELAGEHASVEAARYEALTNRDAALGLHELQHVEALELADRLEEFGATAEPAVAKGEAAALAAAADALKIELETGAEADDPNAEEVASLASVEAAMLAAAVDAARDAETAATDGKHDTMPANTEQVKNQQSTQVGTLPVHYLDFSINTARDIAFPGAPEELTTVSDEKVNAEVVETLRETLERSKAKLTEAQAEEAAAAQKVTDLNTAIEDARDVLAEVALSFPQQATKVAKAAPKATDTKKLNATATVAAESGTHIHGMWDAVADYIAEAKAVQAAHKKIVDKEAADAAAAEAAAAGAAGYSDPATGNYVYVEPSWTGGGNTWSGSGGGAGSTPTPSGNGGGVPAGSGSGSSGGATGSGGYDPGYTPSPHSCTPAPPGWYPTGGSMNGCPTFLPPGGGDTEGW